MGWPESMNRKQVADALLKPFGLELHRRADHEEKPWDHMFLSGIRLEQNGGNPNDAVVAAWGSPQW